MIITILLLPLGHISNKRLGRTPAAQRSGADGETRSPGRASPSTGIEEEEEGQGCAEGEGEVYLPRAKTPLYL